MSRITNSTIYLSLQIRTRSKRVPMGGSLFLLAEIPPNSFMVILFYLNPNNSYKPKILHFSLEDLGIAWGIAANVIKLRDFSSIYRLWRSIYVLILCDSSFVGMTKQECLRMFYQASLSSRRRRDHTRCSTILEKTAFFFLT